MLNERKLTKSELAKREDIIMKMKKNKRSLVQKYGKDAEAVMYGRATNLAKKQAEAMDQDKIKELVKDALQNPKKADLNKDGKLSDYEKKRGAAIEKNMEKVDEMDLNDPVAMKMRAAKDKLSKMRAANAGDDGNDKFFAKNAARLGKLKALKDKRAQIMRDMEQEAEMEGGPTADKYGDMLNKIDKAIAILSEDNLNEGFYGPGGVESITYALGYSDPYEFFEDNPGAVDALLDWAQNIPEFNEMLQDADLLQEDLDLGHEDNEPHMLKADLYRIGKYAMELYQMVDRFEEGSEEVDFPHWWQSKVIKAKDMLVSAKHYLDFEIKEPQIDAMVDVAQDTEAIDEAKSLKDIVNSVSKKGNLNDVIARVKDLVKKENLGFSDEEIELEVENSFDRMMGLGENARDKASMAFDKMKVGATIKTSKGEFKKIDDKHFEMVGKPGRKFTAKQMTFIKEDVIDEAKFTDYSNNELAAYFKNNPKDKAAAAELKKRSQKLKDLSRTDIKEDAIDENAIGINDRRLDDRQKSALDRAVRGDSAYTFGNDPYADDQLRYKYAKKMGFLEEKKEIKEGTWSVGSSKDIKSVMDALDQMMDFKNPKDIVRYLSKLDRFLYNTIGDDIFHDSIDSAKSEAKEGNMDRAQNNLSDAYGRAQYFLERQMDREGLKEEEAGEADMVASDIQKAMNKHKGDDAKMYQLQKARTAMNKGDLDKAKKIAARLAEKLKSN